MSEVYDLLILGGGPGGLAAGIYGGRARLTTALIDRKGYGGQASTTSDLENYPGFGRGTTGPELMEAMAEHSRSMGCQFIRDEIIDVDLSSNPKKLVGRQAEYYGKTVILAPGAEARELHVPGERTLRGKGVSYCATCDAEFFEELEVVVVGSGDAAIEEAIYLTKFCETVTIVVLHDEGIVDANRVAAERAMANEKIKWIWNSVVEKVNGDGLVDSVTLKNLKTGALSDYTTNGVFIFIGTEPKTDFLKGKIALDPQGYIIADEKMQTSLEGVYAVGDCRVKYLRQVVTATADGAIAAVAAEKYIHESEAFDQEVLQAVKPVLLAYYSPHDIKSLEIAGMVERLIGESNGKWGFVKIDASHNELLTRRYHVQKVPCWHLFVDGKVIDTLEAASLEEVRSWIASRISG